MALTTVRPQGMGFVTGRRNLIINGAMQVAQRGTSSTGVGANSGYFTVDRFLFGRENSGQAARMTLSQESVSSGDAPFTTDGHNKMLKIDVTTASGGISAGDAHYISQRLEGQNVFHLAYGGSSAKSVTLSFWMKTDTKTGIMGVSLFHGGARTNVQEISLTTSWQKFELTYSGDTGDTFANDNSSEFQVQWALSAGSNFQVTANQWADGFDLSTSNQVDFTDSTSNNIYLTGVQLELGDNASDFEHRSFGEELGLCQRYYQKSYGHDDAPGTVTSGNKGNDFIYLMGGSTSPHINVKFSPEMRVTPTVTTYSTQNANTTGKLTASTTDYSTGTNGVVNSEKNYLVFASSVTAADDVYVAWVADSEL